MTSLSIVFAAAAYLVRVRVRARARVWVWVRVRANVAAYGLARDSRSHVRASKSCAPGLGLVVRA